MDVQNLPWDAQARLLLDAQFACGVLGNASTRDVLLVDLATEFPLSDEACAGAQQRGLYFCGVMALSKNGVADVACEPGPDTLAVMCLASLPFVKRVMERALMTAGDGASWLERLHSLPDTRSEN